MRNSTDRLQNVLPSPKREQKSRQVSTIGLGPEPTLKISFRSYVYNLDGVTGLALKIKPPRPVLL